MFVPARSGLFVKYGEEQASLIGVQGGRIQPNSHPPQSQPVSVLEQNAVLDLRPVQNFPVAVDCSCLRSTASNLSARSRTNENEMKLGDRLSHLMSSSYTDEENEIERKEDNKEDDESLRLTNLFATLQKFSSRVLNPLQARSIGRLAKSYRGRERITKQHLQSIQEFLDCDSPPIQDAILLALSRLAMRADNVEFLFAHCMHLLDSVLSLASDAPTIEVQVSALSFIEQVTRKPEYITKWEQQLEDIIYPLVHAIVKNRESAEVQKLSSLRVMRNLSQSPDFAAKVKQDILSQLNSIQDNSKVKGLYLEILQENLELSKQRIATDVLDNTLLPVLTSMLAEGPCKTQCQSLKLLTCICDDDVNRASLLSSPQTVALSVLCAKHSKCRKVCALACHMIEELLNIRVITEARKFMDCNSESIQLEEGESEPASRKGREEKMTSSMRRRSRAEALLWRHFDDLISHLVSHLEKHGCIYMERNIIKCELSLIGSINGDQLSSITSLIGCFSNLCMWPLKRPRKSGGQIGDVEEFLSLDDLNLEMKNLNHHHAMNVWTQVGSQVMALFRQVLKRLPDSTTSSQKQPKLTRNILAEDTNNPASESEEMRKQEDSVSMAISKPLESVLYPEEAKLLKILVKFVFVMCVVSCYFKRPSSGDGQPNSARAGQPNSARAANESVENRMKEELTEKEMCAERRVLRRALVEEGMFYLMSHLITVQDSYIKTMSAAILRLSLQPVNEKALAASRRKLTQKGPQSQQKLRPQSARPASEGQARHTVGQTLFSMGKPGLGQRPESPVPYCTSRTSASGNLGGPVADKTGRPRPASAKPQMYSRETTIITRPSSAKYSMFSPLTASSAKKPLSQRSGSAASQQNDVRPPTRASSLTVGKFSRSNTFAVGRGADIQKKSVTFNPKAESCQDTSTEAILTAPLDVGNNLSQQCCERAMLASGEVALKGIFSTDLSVRKSTLLFLHDLVQHSNSEVHMELSKLGCIPKLIDFLRINDDDELLEITGLTVTRMLVSSDRRICQLFNIHGGSNMLMALLHKHPTENLKKAISSTLNTVNQVMHTTDPLSASAETSRRAADIWGHIMQRWEDEDKVVEVLKQFL